MLPRKSDFPGIIFVITLAMLAFFISKLDFIAKLGFSPLVIGIVLGMILANTMHHKVPASYQSGITFSAKRILRFAIVLYGFRFTFEDIASVGLEGFLVSLTMLTTTMLLGSFIGMKIFKMDKETSILTASGAAVCGAAAVLATEPVVKAKEDSVAIAVSMVVLFGTLSMFLYPVFYEVFIKNAHGFFHMSPSEFGIYIGGTIHEVAQVVAVPASIPKSPEIMAHNAVIVKMTRVLLIAPMLLVLGFILAKTSKQSNTKTKITIPWFAVYFLLVVAFNSFHLLPKNIVNTINLIDTFLLTMAMSALGIRTHFAKFKTSGFQALFSAATIYIWLVVGGFVVTKIIINLT